MIKRTETADLIEMIVNEIDLSFVGDQWNDEGPDSNGDNVFSINTCDTKWLQPCAKLLNIAGTDYEITKVDHNSKLYIKADSAPAETSFDIYAPNFFHGTISQVQLELAKIKTLDNKIPMIFLLEGIQETIYLNDNIADRESEIRMFCLSLGRFKDWVSSDDYEEVILPMRSLSYVLIDAIQKSTFTINADIFDIVNRSKMAVSLAPKGATKKIFADDLSGTDISINIAFSREGCKKCSINN